MINEYWDHPRLTMQIVMLVEEMSVALGDEFRTSVAPLIPKMLHVLQKDQSPGAQATIRVLHALDVFGETIDDFLHLIIPAVLALLFPQSTVPGAFPIPRAQSSSTSKLTGALCLFPFSFFAPACFAIAARQPLRLFRRHPSTHQTTTVQHSRNCPRLGRHASPSATKKSRSK